MINDRILLISENNNAFEPLSFGVIYDLDRLAPTYQVILKFNDFIGNLLTLKQKCALVITTKNIDRKLKYRSFDETIESIKSTGSIVYDSLIINNVETVDLPKGKSDSLQENLDSYGGKAVAINLLPSYLYERCKNYYFNYGVEASKVIGVICQESPIFSKKLSDKKVVIKNTDKYDFLNFELNEGSTISNIDKITKRVLLKGSPSYFFENLGGKFRFTSYNQELSDKTRIYNLNQTALDTIGICEKWDFDFKIGDPSVPITRLLNESSNYIVTKDCKVGVDTEERKATYDTIEGDVFSDLYQKQLRGINNSEILSPYVKQLKEPTNSELRAYEADLRKKRELEKLYQVIIKADKLDIVTLTQIFSENSRFLDVGALHRMSIFSKGFALNNTIMMLRYIYLSVDKIDPKLGESGANARMEMVFSAPTLMYYQEEDLKEVSNYETLANKF